MTIDRDLVFLGLRKTEGAAFKSQVFFHLD
jgi:hypothetical protein